MKNKYKNNKYKNADEFIKAFKTEPSSKPVLNSIKSGRIPDISKKTLKDWNIKPGLDDCYRKSQFLELRKKIVQEYLKKYGTIPTTPIERIKKFDFILNISQNVYEIQRLILLTLSDKFQKEIRRLRKKYKIPPEGFKSIDLNDKEFSKWKFRREIYPEQLEKDASKLFQLYKLETHRFLGPILIVSELDLKEMLQWKQTDFSFDHILTQDSFDDQDSLEDTGHPSPLIYAYLIAITRPVETKKQLQDFIDYNWEKIKCGTREHFKWVTLNKEFGRDYLIYSYYKSGKSPKEIEELLKLEHKQYKRGKFSESQIKQTIMRLKRRIKKLEEVTQD